MQFFNSHTCLQQLLLRCFKRVARLMFRDLETDEVVDCGDRDRVIRLYPYFFA